MNIIAIAQVKGFAGPMRIPGAYQSVVENKFKNGEISEKERAELLRPFSPSQSGEKV